MIDSIKKKRITPPVAMFLIRWWSAGAIYFFIGWGTGAGLYSSLIDLIFMLGIVAGFVESYVLGPIFKALFGFGLIQNYKNLSYVKKFLKRLTDFVIALIIIYIVAGIYWLMNYLVPVLGMETFIGNLALFFGIEKGAGQVRVEPIFFGLFYTILSTLFSTIIGMISKFTRKR
jgi:hypothetical protein